MEITKNDLLNFGYKSFESVLPSKTYFKIVKVSEDEPIVICAEFSSDNNVDFRSQFRTKNLDRAYEVSTIGWFLNTDEKDKATRTILLDVEAFFISQYMLSKQIL